MHLILVICQALIVNFLSADEVNAVVIDLGSSLAKAGYAGEDAPKAVFPSVSLHPLRTLNVSGPGSRSRGLLLDMLAEIRLKFRAQQ